MYSSDINYPICKIQQNLTKSHIKNCTVCKELIESMSRSPFNVPSGACHSLAIITINHVEKCDQCKLAVKNFVIEQRKEHEELGFTN